VTFTGTYPASITPTKLASLATARGNFQQASSVVLSATPTSIAVEVFTFTAAPDAASSDVDDDFSIGVDLGQ